VGNLQIAFFKLNRDQDVQGDTERSVSLQAQAQSMAEDDWSETDAEALAE
jgi:hypothetical protein